MQLRVLTCELLAQVVGRGQHRPSDHLAEQVLGSAGRVPGPCLGSGVEDAELQKIFWAF